MKTCSCEDLLSRLDELLDGELARAEVESARDHLSDCPACRSEMEAIQRLRAAARSLPDSIQPQRDLWPGIAAGIEGSKIVRGKFHRPNSSVVRWLTATAAAAVLVALVTSAYLVGRHQARPQVAEAPTMDSSFQTAAYTGVEPDFERARNQLLKGLEQRRNELSPATWSVVMDNIGVIDEAITRIEAALEENPGDGRLNRRLAVAYRQQIDLLQRATLLPAEV